MEILLENIYTGDRLSRESMVFQATLYIEGYKVGVITNDGQGAATMYRPLDDKGILLIRKAEVWCRTLPPMVLQDTLTDGQPVTVPMELEIYLDKLITEWLMLKDIDTFQRNARKRMYYSILYGLPDKTCKEMTYMISIERLIKLPGGIDQLRQDIHRKVLPVLQDGEKILNTNISRIVIQRLAVPLEKWADTRGFKNERSKGNSRFHGAGRY